MAFVTLTAGDRLILADGMNVRPKIPKSGYTPRVGDLVTFDAATQDGCDLIAGNESIDGIIIAINSWDASNITRPVSVAGTHSGFSITLAYTGVLALGNKVGFSSATPDSLLGRTQVLENNANGWGKVTAIDAGTQYGTGYCVVEFP